MAKEASETQYCKFLPVTKTRTYISVENVVFTFLIFQLADCAHVDHGKTT